MSRKDYVAIAAVIARIADPDVRRAVALDMASAIYRPRFDRGRFLAACGVEA